MNFYEDFRNTMSNINNSELIFFGYSLLLKTTKYILDKHVVVHIDN